MRLNRLWGTDHTGPYRPVLGLSKMGAHWRVLSREVTGSDLCLESVTLAAMKGRDCGAQATQGMGPNPCSTQAGGGAGAGMVGVETSR